jgi:predicted GNAT superfamily acetyltransferase
MSSKSMTVAVESLRTLDDLAACERLQRRLFGDHASASVLSVPALRAVAESGGLLLGARVGAATRELAGAVVDLSTTWEGFGALFSHVFGVSPEARNRGVGSSLRVAERRIAQETGIDVIRAWVDPLRSHESHLLWNKMGAIGTTYERNVFGELSDSANRGLATDRVHVEWWLRSPRTLALLEKGQPASHTRVRLHEMVVATRTKVTSTGRRVLVDAKLEPGSANVLVEIPVDVDLLRDEDPAEARRWRVGTRLLFEQLLGTGYLLVGLVHEGGRSFQLFENVDRGAALGHG